MSVRSLLVIAPLILLAGACARQTAGDFVLRGDQQLAAGRYGAAAIEYRNAIKQDPARAEAHRKLGDTYSRQGKPGAAYRSYANAIDLDAADVHSRIAAGRLLLSAGRFDDALVRAEQALECDHGNPEALVLAARAAIAAHDAPAAEGYLTRAIAAEPSSFDAHAMLAHVYASRGDLDVARVTLERFAAAQPDAAAPRTALGIVLEAAGRPAEARARYEQALALDAREPVASNNLARLYATDEGRIGQAFELARTAAAQLPDDADVHDTLGWVAFRTGRLSLAASELKRAVALNAGEPIYQSHLRDVRAEIAAQAEAAAAVRQRVTGRAGL